MVKSQAITMMLYESLLDKTKSKVELRRAGFVLVLFLSSLYFLPSFVDLDQSKSMSKNQESSAVTEFCPHHGHGPLWTRLCQHNFSSLAADVFRSHSSFSIVQIGAHTGWESNDPFATGITAYLTAVAHNSTPAVRNLVNYLFVEASPTNYAVLDENVRNISALLQFNNMKAENIGIVPDNQNAEGLVFYSISDSINVDTGFDSLTGKTLPMWASQLSMFSKTNVVKHVRAWVVSEGLNIGEYVVETKVKVLRLSDLLRQYQDKPFFVLIDTEGLNCDIVAFAVRGTLLPTFLTYEIKHCSPAGIARASEVLLSMGYTLERTDTENVLAFRTT